MFVTEPDVARRWEDLYMAAAKDNIKLAERIGKLEAELTVKGFEIERLRTVVRVNLLRLFPSLSHEAIDAILNGGTDAR